MSSNSYISESLASIEQSSSIIRSLTFHKTEVFTLAVLSPESWFETHLIRDAEPHELSLFRPSDNNRYDPIDASEEEKWVATKRKGPERLGPLDKASPLKEGNNSNRSKASDDPERCILAAQKLLEIYPMPRAREHVDALLLQFEGLKASISDLEEQIKRPLPKAVVNPIQDENSKRALELADAIRREEMEIFALEQIMAEKQLEKSIAVKPKVVRPTPSTSSGSNPFAKSNVLDRKPVITKPTSATTSPITSPRRRVSSTTTTSPSTTTTPRVTRTPSISPVKVRTPIKVSEEITPKAPRIAAQRLANSIGSPSNGIDKSKKSSGVSESELELVATKVWNGVGDTLKPWARKTLLRDGEEIPSPLKELSFKSTLKTLATILTAPPQSNLPTSPGSVASTFLSRTTTTTGLEPEEEDSDPSPLPPTSLLEIELLNLLLSTLSSTKPIPSSIPRYVDVIKNLPILSITMRDTILPSSLISPSSPSSPNSSTTPKVLNTKKQDAMISMNALKFHLGTFCSERNWEDLTNVGTTAMGTTAIYSLVSKAVLRIDRRGKEGPMLGFRN